MNLAHFFWWCEKLAELGWEAKLDGKGAIILRRPKGRTFCFDPMTAVYSEMRGKVCYNTMTAYRNIGLMERTEEVRAAMKKSSTHEGNGPYCLNLYRQMLASLAIQT